MIQCKYITQRFFNNQIKPDYASAYLINTHGLDDHHLPSASKGSGGVKDACDLALILKMYRGFSTLIISNSKCTTSTHLHE